VWGEVAAARTDDELRQWYERHMEDVRRQADGQRRTGGPTESRRRQAVSYADFMTRKESSARARIRRSTPESPAPSDRVDADGIYRPPPATAEDGGSPDTVRDAGRTTEDRVQPGSTSVDERDSWNADDYPADVAPPPSVPPRADR
jgi:hypothetical protein